MLGEPPVPSLEEQALDRMNQLHAVREGSADEQPPKGNAAWRSGIRDPFRSRFESR